MEFEQLKVFAKKLQCEGKLCFKDKQSHLQELGNCKKTIRKNKRENRIEVDALKDSIEELKVSGLNRYSMSNPEYFVKKRRACKDLYGLFDFSFLVHFI